MVRLLATAVVSLTLLSPALSNVISPDMRKASGLSKLVSQSTPDGDTSSRHLDEYYNDISWMADYSIKFDGCHSIVQYAEEGGGGEEALSKTRRQHLARYKMCKSNACNTDCKGEYLVDLGIFVDAYTEFTMELQEYQCEQVRENCNCEYANDDEVCESGCYQEAGLDYCVENQDEYEDEFEVQRYIECVEMEMNNQQYNQYGQEIRYFIGPACSSDGKSVHLQVYSDETCSTKASNGIYQSNNYYGKPLPYSTESLIQTNCISCEEKDEDRNNYNNYNNGYNNNNDREIADICEETYEESAKCEDGMDISYPRVSSMSP